MDVEAAGDAKRHQWPGGRRQLDQLGTSSGPAGFFRSIFSIHHPMMGKPWETPNFDQKIGGSFGKSS